MKDYFLNMLKYNSWANSRSLDSIEKTKSDKAQKIFGHILDAQTTWLVRIKDPEKASKNFWNFYPIADMKTLLEKSNKDWEEFVNNLSPEDFNKVCAYTNSVGKNYSNTIGEILTHVLNHSNYHRGQIASIIRDEGGEPALTDFIVYSR